MSDADDAPARPGHHGWLEEEPEQPAFRDVELPPARWASLRSSLSPEEVRQRVAGGVKDRADGLVLSQTRSGFVARWTRGTKVLVAEISLTGWEEGTQIHLVVPKDTGATDKDVQVLKKRLSDALGGVEAGGPA